MADAVTNMTAAFNSGLAGHDEISALGRATAHTTTSFFRDDPFIGADRVPHVALYLPIR